MLRLTMSVLLSVLAVNNAFSTPEGKADAPPSPETPCGPDDNADDCTALVALNHATGGNLDWKVDGKTSLCTWPGVTCSNSTKRVDKIDLNAHEDKRLTGYIPSEIGLLTAMTSLGLNYNHLTGSIPSEVGQLTAMTTLDLRNNGLTGSIPSEVGLLTAMTYLGLSDNSLTGSIPSEVGLLTAMTKLYLYDNGLTGSVPSEICNLQVSRYCSLANNLFSCPVPSCPLMARCGVTCK